MRNYVQPGDTITIPAPEAVISGQPIQVGALFGIASTTALAGSDVALGVTGVYELPKEPTTDVLAVGDAVEWDAGAGHVVALDSGNRVGVVVAGAAATNPTVRVRLA